MLHDSYGVLKPYVVVNELVRPQTPPEACPQCGAPVDGAASRQAHYGQTACDPPAIEVEDGSERVTDRDQFVTDRQAQRYLAQRFLGRTDENALSRVAGHLRTAALPEPVQALFKTPAERTAHEEDTLATDGIETQATLGSGDGRSGTAREVVALHDAVANELADDAVEPTVAVLEVVGSLRHEEMSEQNLRRTIRDFRRKLTAEIDALQSAAEQRTQFTETLATQATELREVYETVDPTRPFTRVDVIGLETQQHSRWHVRVKAKRGMSGHGELVRELYQAATGLGWEALSVVVYDSSLAALSATETASIVHEWSTYEWAQYCQSLAVELRQASDSRRQVAARVAARTSRSTQTVQRYLNGLSLPTVVHPLLCDGPAGDEQAWQALQNYNGSVRQYNGLSWTVAARLGRRGREEGVTVDRTIGAAAHAVEYETSAALTFVDRAMTEPAVPFRTVHRQMQQTNRYGESLQVPSVTVALETAEREAIMAYCAEQRQPLSALIESQIRALATELIEQ